MSPHRTPSLAVLAALLIWSPVGAAERLRVVATTTDLAAIAAAVGGDAIDVRALCRGPQDPHFLQARPSYMRRLRDADLLIFNGLQLEIGWLPMLVEGARNPRVVGAPGQLDVAAAVEPLEVPTGSVDRSMGDVHPEGNPHYLLDPRNGLRAADLIARRLTELAPGSADRFEAARRDFARGFAARIVAWEGRGAAWRGRRVVCYHKQFEYFAVWLGLDIVGYIEDRPGIPPTARHVARLVEHMGAQEVRVVLQSTYTDPAPARRVAERAGARVVVLPAAVGAIDEAGDYGVLFDVILARLQSGFADTAP